MYLSDIISDLFSLELDVPLQLVFLSLDAVSLKHCRLVCKKWDNFIKFRVWGTEAGSEPNCRMRQSLAFHWRHATPSSRSEDLDVASVVNSLACDDRVVVAGFKDATAKVYHIEDMILAAELDCRNLSLPTRRQKCIDVRSAVGKEVVATVTDQGDVSVWRRSDWSNVYKQSHHGDQPVYAVKILHSLILTGGCDKMLTVLSWDGERVRMVMRLGENPPDPMPTFQMLMDNPWYITHLDTDGEMVLVGTNIDIKLWSLKEKLLVKSFDTLWIYSLALSYPYAIFAKANGLTVMDLVTGQEYFKETCKSAITSHLVTSQLTFLGNMQISHYQSMLVGSIPNHPMATKHRQSLYFLDLKQMI